MTSTSSFSEQLQNNESLILPPDEIEGFPYDEYSKRLLEYSDQEYWYSGEALKEKVSEKNKTFELYPVQINMLKETVTKHASMLMGHFEINDYPVIRPRIVAKEEKDTEQAAKLEEVVLDILMENGASSLYADNALLSQKHGGCIFQVKYEPQDPLLSYPIRVLSIHPKYFVGLPSGNDFWNLREAWVVLPISAQEANEVHGTNFDVEKNEKLWLVEHYTRKKIRAFVTGHGVMAQSANRSYKDPVTGKMVIRPVDEKNVFGVVPFFYIPHIRAGKFYGESVIDDLKGVLKDLNARVGDYGDAVNLDSHPSVVVASQGEIEKIDRLTPDNRVTFYSVRASGGGVASLEGGEVKIPSVNTVATNASQSAGEMIELLLGIYQRLASIPPVAYGIDEGSQRSGATLAVRMWPLISHAQLERAYWLVGLNQVVKTILMILAVKGIIPGLKLEDIKKFRFKQNFAPYLPRDREMVVNEAVARVPAGLGAIEDMLEMLGDSDNPEKTKDKIAETMELLGLGKYAINTMGFGAGGDQKKKPDGISTTRKQGEK